MKRFIISIFSVLAYAPLAFSKADVSSLETKIQALLKPYAEKAGVSVRSLSGESLVSVNETKMMVPASTAKLISTGCALRALGPQFQFETKFGIRGRVEKGKLNGDLVIRGAGDPSFVIEDLREVVEKLRYVYGLEGLQGNLIFDVSYFGHESLPISDDFGGDEGRAFTADLTPVAVNNNAFSIWIYPHLEGSGGGAAVLPYNVTDVKLNSSVKKAGSADAKAQGSVQYNAATKAAHVTGSVGSHGEPRGYYRSISEPYVYFYRIFRRLWLESGGIWPAPSSKNAFKVEKNVSGVRPLLTYQSRPLARILSDINKFSLNFSAELVLIAAGANRFGEPATKDKATKVMNECVSALVADQAKNIALTNASGLSRDAKMSPESLTRFLSDYAQTSFAPEFMSSLPILGLDGTVKAVLPEYPGRARLKTGTLKDVRTIAGYLKTEGGEMWSVALFFNQLPGGPGSVSQTEEKIFRALLDFK